MKLFALVALLCAALVVPAGADPPAKDQEQVAVRGHVLVAPNHDADHRLETDDGKVWTLVVETDAFHSLHDPELAGRTWELVGYPLGDDRFDVRKLFTIKDGERHAVTYYCEICHIVSYRPGMCMCCQEDVELRETPVEK